MATVLPFPLEPSRLHAATGAGAPALKAWIDRGPTVRELLAEGPLPERQAALAVRELGRAVEALHRRGVHHGAVGPDTVVVTPGARARLLDPIAWRREDGPRGRTEGPLSEEAVRSDVRDLGLLLRAMLGESPSARRTHGLGAVAERAISGRSYRTCGALCRALDRFLLLSRFRLA